MSKARRGATSRIRLITFPGAPNLPIFAALERGDFLRRGLEVQMETTPSSIFQMENLMSGRFQIAGTAFDNVVAYREGQGAVESLGPCDLVAFMGATRIELSLVVEPGIRTWDDLRRRSLALDALNTGFAFVLYDMLERAGMSIGDCELVPVGATPARWASVRAGEHAGTLTIEPFTSIAVANGFRVLQSSSDTVPHYQGGVFAATPAWIADHGEALGGFIRSYLAGLRWTLEPSNYDAAKELLLNRMPAIKPPVADAVMGKLLDPATGLTPEAEFDWKGIEMVLDLRSRYAPGAVPLTDSARYLDSRRLRGAGIGVDPTTVKSAFPGAHMRK